MPTLDEFIVALARHVAHERGWTLAAATRWVEVRVAAARDEYREKGAPLGDTDEGFVAWMTPRHQPPAA